MWGGGIATFASAHLGITMRYLSLLIRLISLHPPLWISQIFHPTTIPFNLKSVVLHFLPFSVNLGALMAVYHDVNDYSGIPAFGIWRVSRTFDGYFVPDL